METRRLDEGVVRTDAPNGLIVLTETMPGLRSAAGGFWVRTASVHEQCDTEQRSTLRKRARLVAIVTLRVPQYPQAHDRR